MHHWEEGQYKGYKMENFGDYAAAMVYKGEQKMLELRVSGTAIATGVRVPDGKTLYDWIWETALPIAKENQEAGLILTVTSHDVADGKLTTHWKNLRREKS
ncbi:hypothetical protein PA598K_06874 [Paenibacillus sp. 598K]|uniref:hypothetical protein n=1 Tax=Paenibacillus sp. 598K TaxID=1117987 RepID=UPI000FF91F23|nr:hypothetical protein [Paenibacillus sp. 598K]GBF78256.1 hypothetical protein PA598K_06874 [Paenibacillus sp. 598K]